MSLPGIMSIIRPAFAPPDVPSIQALNSLEAGPALPARLNKPSMKNWFRMEVVSVYLEFTYIILMDIGSRE